MYPSTEDTFEDLKKLIALKLHKPVGTQTLVKGNGNRNSAADVLVDTAAISSWCTSQSVWFWDGSQAPCVIDVYLDATTAQVE